MAVHRARLRLRVRVVVTTDIDGMTIVGAVGEDRDTSEHRMALI